MANNELYSNTYKSDHIGQLTHETQRKSLLEGRTRFQSEHGSVATLTPRATLQEASGLHHDITRLSSSLDDLLRLQPQRLRKISTPPQQRTLRSPHTVTARTTSSFFQSINQSINDIDRRRLLVSLYVCLLYTSPSPRD